MTRALLCVACMALLIGCSKGDVQKVIEGTVKLCGYQPTVEVVSAVLGSSVPGVSGVGPVTKAICNAVTRQNQVQSLTSACPQVNGVCIEGEWVDDESVPPADSK